MSKNNAEWMNDPLLKDIEKHKLDFLQTMVFESNSLSADSMLPFLLSVMKRGQKKKLTFSDVEIESVITVLKKHSTPDELEKINLIMNIRKTGNVPDMLKNHPGMKSYSKSAQNAD
ncbi:MAG: hypothetical protein FWC09_03615 [Lachnospiraceae bacterium]|nr:hypothetical protein [Lachnospiraceae bacterium]